MRMLTIALAAMGASLWTTPAFAGDCAEFAYEDVMAEEIAAINVEPGPVVTAPVQTVEPATSEGKTS